MVPWRVIDTGAGHGAYNMGVDQALVEGVDQGPVLRFYGWDPPAVSCGYGQRVEREVDLEACRALGVDVVRRPTGGRAVLHWEELTYCVVCDPSDLGSGAAIADAYRTIAECLAAGLRRLGVAVDVERTRRAVERSRGRQATSPCFSSVARWELKYRGRKLVGSAQRRLRQGMLQHGSILLGRAHERLPQLLRIDQAQCREWTAALQMSSIDLGRCAQVQRDELVRCLVWGFGQRLGVEMRWDDLSADEARRAVELAGASAELEEIGA